MLHNQQIQFKSNSWFTFFFPQFLFNWGTYNDIFIYIKLPTS